MNLQNCRKLTVLGCVVGTLLVTLVYHNELYGTEKSNISQDKVEKDYVKIPKQLNELFNIEFLGAFRVQAKGESNSSYAVGTLAFNPSNDSLFLAGHDHHDAVAEFKIPKKLTYRKNVKDLPQAKVIQPYVKVLNKKQDGNSTDKITGLLYYEGKLLVNSEIWYDGAGKNKDNHIVFNDANSLKNSKYLGMLRLQGGAMAAGYMSHIPEHLQAKLNGHYLTGWASNYAITSRYSQGPSIYVFDPQDSIRANRSLDTINTIPKMVFPFADGKSMVKDSDKYLDIISPIWGPLSNARYGFIVPKTKWFLVVGHHGGIDGGVGYKIKQENGRRCNGVCPKKASDVYNYFWLFNVDTILAAPQPHMVQPFSYGKWNHPYDKNGKHKLIGATFDHETGRLFISLANAGRVGKFDRPPLIVTYQIKAKSY